jgi:putative redox protein
MGDTTVEITTIQGLAHRVRARHHELVADEPPEAGGTDAGMTPYELLLSAVGACMAMTARLYADRKGWPLTAVRVRLRYRKITGQPDEIAAEFTFRGDLDAEQRDRLLQIAGRCPVHRTLEAGIRFQEALAEEVHP